MLSLVIERIVPDFIFLVGILQVMKKHIAFRFLDKKRKIWPINLLPLESFLIVDLKRNWY